MLKILVVEDDLMIADMAEEILVDAGYEVCGIAHTVTEGVALARQHKPDLALIDLLHGLKLVSEIVSTGKAALPFPRGFHVLRPATPAPATMGA